MKTGPRKVQILLVILICTLVGLFPAYLDYSYLAGTDLPSSIPIFENPDQDYLIANQQDKLRLSGPDFSIIREDSLQEQLSYFASQTLSAQIEAFNPRC